MRFALLLSTVGLLRAQGTPPKTAPTDYPVHIQMDAVALAADYLVHSLPTTQGTLVANDYLVVEVAFFGPPYSRLKMSPDNFSLRINTKGDPLTPEPAGMVSQSIKFPGAHPHLETTGTVTNGDGTVTVGPRPPPSHIPTVNEVNEENSVQYRVQASSLPEGEHPLPRSGLLYFFYKGKTKNIRTVELLYNGPMGKSTLKLLP
jgi:hypothetical protein